jgi:hypothetical protein
MKKTIKELLEIDNVIGGLYKKDITLRDTKFGYAWKKFYSKNIKPAIEEYEEKITDIRIDNALTDEKTKAILEDKENERGFKYSIDGLKKCLDQERKAFKDLELKEIKVEPYLSGYVPDGLTEEQKELLTGTIL